MSTAIVLASSVAAVPAAPAPAPAPAHPRLNGADEARRQRGVAIADVSRIERKRDDLWVVPSQTGNGKYWVRIIDDQRATCTCKDFEIRGRTCKHIYAVRRIIERQDCPDDDPPPTPTPDVVKRTVAPRPTYKQDWPAYNAAQIHEKAKFQALLAELCRGIPLPPAKLKGGRPPVPMGGRVFAAALKVYTTMSGRRASTDMRDARDKGHQAYAPHYSRVSRFLEDQAMTPVLKGLIAESAKPLRSVECDFIIDSSGFATSRFVRWFDHKYGVVKKEYDWVKVSVCTGRTTNVVTAVEIDERYAGDCPRFAPLLNATAKAFTVREVLADSAYLSYENVELVVSHGGTPYIAFKSNTTAADGGTLARMFHLYQFKRDEYLAHYHKRSNVESTFSMIKAKFGDSLRSKTDTAMANEALAKVLNHNICCLIQSHYELGINAAFWGDESTALPTAVESSEAKPFEMWVWV